MRTAMWSVVQGTVIIVVTILLGLWFQRLQNNPNVGVGVVAAFVPAFLIAVGAFYGIPAFIRRRRSAAREAVEVGQSAEL